MKKITTKEFMRRAKKIHNNKYDYSKTIYKTAKTKIIIICNKCGYEFEQTPYSHLSGCGCPNCVGLARITTEEFIKRSNITHNNKYDYSKSVYKTAKTKVEIICPIHGEFKQDAYVHMKGHGCSKCAHGARIKVKQKCKSCGKLAFLSNKLLCKNCYNKTRPKKICSICGEKDIVKAYKNNKPLCPSCYLKNRKKKKCSNCGEYDVLHKANPPLCFSCYSQLKPKKFCINCKKLKKIYSKGLCRKCYNYWRNENDEVYRITELLRSRLKNAFKYFSSNGKIKSADEYGIDYNKIIQHLGPCPGNRKDYHIDHIFPLCAFDFNDIKQIRAAFAPENHQWLKKEDNMKKHSYYEQKEFEKYITKFVK